MPMASLFNQLTEGITLYELLEGFPSVSRVQVNAVLDGASNLMAAKNIAQLFYAVVGFSWNMQRF